MTIIERVTDAQGFAHMISRLAHMILERNRPIDDLVLIGLRTRGEFVGRRLGETITDITGHIPPFGVLDVTLYRDDVRQQHLRQPEVRATDIAFDISDKHVLLVDDVLYTGRTVRAALDALVDLGRPRTIQLVVIVDRGHRELPIRADFVGREIVTTAGQEVRVKLREVDEEDGIDLVSID